MEGWTSKVYKYFRDPFIVVKGDAVKYNSLAKCMCFNHFYQCIAVFNRLFSHPLPSCTQARTDNATTSLLCHVDSCEEKIAPDDQVISTFAHGSIYSAGRKFRYLVALWISQCYQPFKIIEDKPHQNMLRMLYSKIKIPSSDSTVSQVVKKVHMISLKKNVVCSFMLS
jgi:hypothetical protein